MKEISYEGQEAEKEESAWVKKKKPSTGSKTAPTVRTFRADVEELIQEKGTTRSEIIQAEAARRESRGETRFPVEEEASHLGRIIFILVLVLAFGLGIGMYALIGTKVEIPFLQIATSTGEKVVSDDTVIMLTNSPREQVLTDIALAFAKTLSQSGKHTIVFNIKNTEGETSGASLLNFLETVGTEKAPKALVDSLDPLLTFHIYSGIAPTGVLMLRSRSYANTFFEMLEWEGRAASTLVPVLHPEYGRTALKELEGRVFRDERVREYDTRTLRDALGNAILSYAFVNKKILVIAGNQDALLKEIETLSVEK